VYDLFDSFRSQLSGFRSFFTNVRALLEPHYRPGWIRQRWFTYSLTGLSVAFAVRTAFVNKDAIVHGILSMRVTLENFFFRYLWHPMQDIYRTIRYDRSTFALMDPSALHSDEESLVRMVDNFVKKKRELQIPQEQVPPLLERALEKGDLAILMPTYEKEIQTPIRSALLGDLVQLLLIQVQRQRIDVERAMLALDKLMRANEFNFQALALLPAAAITYFTLGGAGRLLTQQALPLPTVTGFRAEMREVSTIVISAMSDSNGAAAAEMSLEDQGLLLLCLARMTAGLQVLPMAVRRQFAQDLRFLAFNTPLVSQKQATIDRMFVSYPFLRS
jgi:nuclear-control-of-ATPase protein 2